jgi:hypothetical protein
MAKIFEKLIFGGLHEKHAAQRPVLRGNPLCASQRTAKGTLVSAVPLQPYLGVTADACRYLGNSS